MDILDLIKGKVRFDGYSDGAIFDEENNHIADARSWGRIQYMEEPDKKHDFLARFIADAINEKLENDKIKEQLGLPDRGIIIVGAGAEGKTALSELVEEKEKVYDITKLPDLPEPQRIINLKEGEKHSRKRKRGHFKNRFQ